MESIIHLLTVVFVQPLLNLLFLIYGVIPGHSFGIAVIILTAIIRFALWPLTAKQLHGQKKMQELAPDIAKVKQQSKGDKQKESQMLMELYKEKEISPFSACLPALLQFPFLIALYFVFQKSTHDVQALSGLLYAPIKSLPFIQSIIQNPSSFTPSLFGWINMATPSIPLALFAGITQYIQVKMLAPKKVPGSKDPQAQATQMMNYTFPLLTVFIAWRLPAALPLYWSVTNLISIGQQYIIMREEVEEMEEVKIVSKKTSTKALPKTKKQKAKKKKG
ncbi:YidC/Oxa1 family membrane protein insertase [Candidatus Saccharibacteria bacterium]|nr:YidC/Oxa1 family membrane protein insertase [Candidatus Saccharibacteria bacterium]